MGLDEDTRTVCVHHQTVERICHPPVGRQQVLQRDHPGEHQ